MSRGNNIMKTRVSEMMEAEMKAELEIHNQKTRGAQWTMSDWIRNAILEKLNHINRGRGRARRTAPQSSTDSPSATGTEDQHDTKSPPEATGQPG